MLFRDTLQFTFNTESLKRHRVSKKECLEVIMNPLSAYLDEAVSNRENARRLYVGFTLSVRLLEVGVEYMSDNRWHIYHAKRANAHNRRKTSL
jgi:hypothetical protein